jgi:hypothetical protein
LHQCFRHIDAARAVSQKGRGWVESTASQCEKHLHTNLIEQRSNLSGATRRIYAIRGNPDGSGIRNHIGNTRNSDRESLRITVGIARGKPTMVAKVQEYGTTIAVTNRMRSWFRRHGINLKSSTVFIRIPGRKFWSKALTSAKKTSKKELKRI